ncbi:MAG: glycosyltransferase [Weeksellaceae bacterium]
MKNRIKLTFVVLGINKEAISFLLIDRINNLIDKGGYEISVVSEHNNDALVKSFRKEVKLYPLNVSQYYKEKRLPVLGYFSLKNKIRQIYQQTIDEIQPDLITVINLEGFYLELIPCIKTKAKKIIEFHLSYFTNKAEVINRPENSLKRLHPVKLLKIKKENLHNRYDIATVLTKEDLKDREYLKIPVHQIYNPVNYPEDVSLFSKREKIIIAVGRLVAVKNFIDLIHAIGSIKEKINGWQVHIYGRGEQKEYLENEITKNNLSEIIFLKGFSDDMPGAFNSARLMVSTSVHEGFGMAILEALCYKVPVVAYDCKCGPKEIVKDGVNGYLIDFSVEQLAEKILELTSNSEKPESFSSHCHDEIERFDFEKIMNQWNEFYRSIVQSQKN